MRVGDEAGIAYGSVYMGQRAVEGETIGAPWFASKKAVVAWVVAFTRRNSLLDSHLLIYR